LSTQILSEFIPFSANTSSAGYAIEGFDQGLDTIAFEGYGNDASIIPEGSGLGDFRVTAASGAFDTFHLDGVQSLAASDYVFRDDAIPTPAEQLPPAPVADTVAPESDYTLVQADDFSYGYQTAKWGDAYNGGTYWNGAFDWSAEDVAVRDGELQVTSTHHADGSWTSGGFSSFKAGQTITYGIVEFDARVEQAQGTQAAILMWPISDAWPRDGEIDILETPKTEAMHSSHWEGSDGSHEFSSIFSDVDVAANNHYKLTWLPDLVTIEVNGQVVAEWTDPAAIPDTAMGFGAMGYVAAAGEEWLGDAPDRSTPDVITTHIDNVNMSQWNGIA
jgi:beta-glucanase (GH16 family)